jgi:hypothetical protein
MENHKEPQDGLGDIIDRESAHDLMIKHAIFLVKGGAEPRQIKNYLSYHAFGIMDMDQQEDLVTDIDEITEKAFSIVFGIKTSVAEDVKSWVETTQGDFSTSDCYRELQISTKRDKKTAYMALLRMVDDKKIERQGKKTGTFRKLNRDAPDIDIFSSGDGCLDIKYPLDMHEFFLTMQKNIIAVAGSQDGGKSCFALNFTRLNMNRHWDLRYQSSEMGNMEMKSRLAKFESTLSIPMRDWKNVNFKEVNSDFQDYILPDGINVVDYLELTEDFFLAGQQIRKIFDKLNKGIALVCLQKKFGARLGYGAETTLKLPRLYVSIEGNPPEGNIATIIKAKNWARDDWNPNNRECTFNIIGGAGIKQRTRWEYARRKSNVI